jgi:O-antigen ligase
MISKGRNWTSLLLSLMMVLVPAAGVPHEQLLQDTLKSILVAFFALAASFVFFWNGRNKERLIHWHGVMLLPLALFAYALGSMVWSHAYLGGVEAVRWFLFSLIFFLGINVFTLERLTHLAWGIHLGAVIASLWAAMQFWIDFNFFAQGPNPASTFVNRNFFGEFLVCTLPFSVLLLSRVRDKTTVFLLTFSMGFNVAALMMTGTRSALLGLMLCGILLPIALAMYGRQFVSTGWRLGHVIAVLSLLFATVAGIASIDSANPKLIAESGPGDAIDRAFKRTLSMAATTEYSQGSFSIRAVMWKATGRMIAANPVTGVGAGAWEVASPLYQTAGSQLETDYYAHNEFLQLLAEYGLVGWLFLFGLSAYLVYATYTTWHLRSTPNQRESLPRALILTSLLTFLLVSNAGFPWRMASTGALFSLGLSALAASDMRLRVSRQCLMSTMIWKPRHSVMALCLTAVCTGIAVYISQQAILCERKITRSVKIAMTISQSGMPNDPRWDTAKSEMLALINEGIVINPHYRKLTPIVADNLATWGDWKNATWIWESVLESRPNVVAMLANVIRGNIQAKDFGKAQEYLNRALKIQPTALSLAPLQVMIWSQVGQPLQAIARAKELLLAGVIEPDLVRTAYFLGVRNHDPSLAILALELRIKTWPNQSVDGWLKLGDIYNSPEAKDERKAEEAYHNALAATLPQHKTAILAMIPPTYREKVQ